MFDLRLIRENPDHFDKGWARRGLEPQAQHIVDLDEQRRSSQTELQTLQQRRNEASKAIGQAKGQGDDAKAEELMAEVSEIKDKMKALEEAEKENAEKLNYLLSALPNIPDDELPDGEDEDSNLEVRKFGGDDLGASNHDHVAIGEGLGLMDFEGAAKVSGARFVYLRGALARLERALAQFMLNMHTGEFGYTEMSVPLLVRDDAMFGAGQLPKFADDAFRTQSDHWLIPTSEVSLANTVYDSMLNAEELPLRLTSLSPCFRLEAGAAGKDTRGMIRQHQFWKVELVSVTAPDKSGEELDRMTDIAEEVLRRLELPFRTVLKCVGDTGFTAHRSYDLEVWLPGQNKYREISSCSNCGDFQARRMKTRFKTDSGTQYVHTLNGSGLAVGRALVAVLENYYVPDENAIRIPEVLKPYMGGLDKIEIHEGLKYKAA